MRTGLPLLLLLPLLLGAETPPVPGGITGKVVLVRGNKPIVRDQIYVYLEEVKRPHRRGTAPGKGLRKEIRQKGEQFVPDVLVVPVGTEVAFPNYDKETHNVFSPTDPIFNLGRYSTNKRGKSHVFDDTDEFDIYCDIHANMRATVKIVDTPYIVRVERGQFKLENVPPGTYKVVAWTTTRSEVKSDPITIKSGEIAQLPETLNLQLVTRSGCHDRFDGTPYPDKYAPCPPER